MTFALMAVIVGTNRFLITPASPMGMVSFQFAGTLAAAQAILASWNHGAQVYAALNLGVDCLYMVAYGAAIGLGCVLLARGLAGRFPLLAQVGIVVAWGVVGAVVLDAVENYALIRLLLGERHTLLPAIARWCAIPKYWLVLAGVSYLVCGGAVGLACRTRI
ncbi:MAG: hypothetical protein ED859_11700 [Desulfuromonadales bacterium]|nr:MAG: hypothetical protein ED859_11700 [Desulfuromonadales bacterium]